MGSSSDHELNLRLIELSQAISSLLDTADSESDIPSLRDEALRAVNEQSDIARRKLAQQSAKE